jgi:chorismate mutase
MNDVQKTDAPERVALEAMRAELDCVDKRLLESLRDRLECCRSIARHKRMFDVPMMQEHRIDIVQQRADRYGREHDIDLEFLRQLYTLIIDETCRVEDLLIGAPTAD